MTMTNNEIKKDNDVTATTKAAQLEATTTHRTVLVKQGNIVSINQLPLSPAMFGMCNEVELVEVKPVFAYDSNNRPILDQIEAIKYTCVDGKNWYDFKVPNQSKPVISQEEIDRRDAAENQVFVRIPLDKLVLKPYQNSGDRGILRISMQVPYIELL